MHAFNLLKVKELLGMSCLDLLNHRELLPLLAEGGLSSKPLTLVWLGVTDMWTPSLIDLLLG